MRIRNTGGDYKKLSQTTIPRLRVPEGGGRERKTERDKYNFEYILYAGTLWLKHIFPMDKARDKEAKQLPFINDNPTGVIYLRTSFQLYCTGSCYCAIHLSTTLQEICNVFPSLASM
jgi:hypothetical protein